jgi:hypothetical protein
MFRRVFASLFLLGCLAAALTAQDFVSLTITVTDTSDSVIPDASVTLVNTQRGTIFHQQTPTGGAVSFDALEPGDYSVTIEKTGFQTRRIDTVTLGVRDRKSLVLELKVAQAQSTTVEVTDRIDVLSSDTGQGVSMDNRYVDNLPTNGRDVDSLILMTPGISTATGGKGDGGINANGLRDNTNYYTIDGVSANRPIGGAGGGGFGGFGGGGGGFGGGGAGSPVDTISMDAMQEMSVQTSPIAPEFGRSAGAQITMTSRAGSSNFHGTLYYYFRNQSMDANDWFANANRLGRGSTHENRPGGVLGGPIVKGKTFFFISLDQLHLTAPYTVIDTVPNLAVRQSTSAALQPFLNAFPVPNSPVQLTDGGAQFESVVSNPSKADTVSLRLDQILSGKATLFVRFQISPSSSDSRGSAITASNIYTNRLSHTETGTVGYGKVLPDGSVNDLRFNYSTYTNASRSIMDNFGGAIPLTSAEVFPSGVTTGTGTFSLNMQGLAGYSFGGRTTDQQQQYNVVDAITKVRGGHHFKAGADFRRVLVTDHRTPYSENVSFNGVFGNADSLTSGSALNAQVLSTVPIVYPTYLNFSLYGQDTWHLTERTTITYGLRWDVSPAPTAREGQKPFALSNNSIAGVTQNDPIYPTKWWNIAPRAGLAYEMDTTPGREMMLRGGFGTFYDPAYSTAGASFNGAPYENVTTISEAVFPLLPQYLAAPALPPTRPYGQVSTAEIGLVTPVIYEYNATLEKHFGYASVLSVGYSGNIGRNLIRVQTQPQYTAAFDIVSETTNGADSHYNGMQLQFRRRISDAFRMQLSYTWSHAEDTASSDFGSGGGFTTLYGVGQKGSSDYDVRQNLNLSGSLRIPAPTQGMIYSPLRHWYLDFVETARTGLPFDIQTISSSASGAVSINGTTVTTTTANNGDTNSTVGLFAQVRPNYNGDPVFISNPNVPGGRELNLAAFDIVSGFAQGNLGRNSIRGFGAQQLDLSLRRAIPITERFTLSLAASAYNAFNHPNFSNPSPFEGANLSSPNFGVVTQMLNQSVGASGNSLFRNGGPRSIELSVKIQF